jgi:subtilisin family serine protease
MYRSALIKIMPFLAVLILISCNKDNGTNPITNSQILKQGFNNQYIVVFAESKINEIAGSAGIAAKVQSVLADHQIPTSDLLFVYEAAIHGFAVRVSHNKALELTKDSRVSYVEADKEIKLENPITTSYNYKENQIQTQGQNWGVNSVGANINTDCSGSNYHTAWIIDTGIDPNWATSRVPELNIQTSLCRNYTTSNTSSWADGNGHGTHVSGIIGAKNNSIGVVGVAPGAKLVAVRVLNSNGSGTYAQVIAGINYVATAAASGDVANMSLGGGASTTLDDAVINASTYNNKTITFCLAAGNDGASATNTSPARANGTYIKTIAAFNSSGQWASFSNYGQPPVDLAAPGVSVLSLVLYRSRTNTASWSGTSMATPFATGIFVANQGTINTSGTVTRSGTDTYNKVHF